MQPGLREVFVGGRGVGEGLGGVVGGEQVFDYGAGFPEGEGGVWVGDGGDAAVWGEGLERLCYGFGVLSGRVSLVGRVVRIVVEHWDDGPFLRSPKSMISVS
jgi:hypothetical protein